MNGWDSGPRDLTASLSQHVWYLGLELSELQQYYIRVHASLPRSRPDQRTHFVIAISHLTHLYGFSIQFPHQPQATMEEQQPPSSLATAFPSPPPFWKSFTPESTTRIAALRAAELPFPRQAQDPACEVPVRILDLPTELRNLQPPEPPVDGSYRCFGDPFRVCFMGNTVHSGEDGGGVSTDWIGVEWIGLEWMAADSDIAR